jgi:DNA-binding MarR family transcriptional regulator
MPADDEPQWLDDEEMAAWIPLMATLVVLPARFDAQMQEVAGLTQFEYLILASLSESENHTKRISELAGQWHGSLSRLSHLVKRLEQRGWVRREPDPEDGRYTNAVLTDAGWAKIVATAPDQVSMVRGLVLDHLSRAQLRQLRAISERLLTQNISDPDMLPHLRVAGRGRPRNE